MAKGRNSDQAQSNEAARRHNMSRRGFVVGVGVMGVSGILGGAGLGGCAPSNAKDSSTGDTTHEAYDVLIVGSGGAGMSAAIGAYNAGVQSLAVLEKMSVTGGNTNYSSSGMNASQTKFQVEQGIQDSNDLFAEETLKGGQNTGNPDLVHFMCDHSADAIDWLDTMGIRLDNIGLTGGMSVKRCHRPTDGSAVGLTLVPGLVKQINERNIPLLMECEATALIKDEKGAVSGVKVVQKGKESTIAAKAVILASGGLGANKDMVARYRPDLKDYKTTNQPGATGDGYTMAEDAGAQLIQMDQIQIHPTVEQSTSTLIAEGIRGNGAILVNNEGKRFYNEMGTRDKVSSAELAQTGASVWVVFDQQIYDANKEIEKYDKANLVKKGSSVSDLADAMGVNPATLKDTIDAYNSIIESAHADEFGRTEGCIVLQENGPMYAIQVAPAIHHEMGGIRINTNNEALDAQGNRIPGLYAAGEVTGGVHGNNRIGGNAVCDITVFGKNVGEVVAASLA